MLKPDIEYIEKLDGYKYAIHTLTNYKFEIDEKTIKILYFLGYFSCLMDEKQNKFLYSIYIGMRVTGIFSHFDLMGFSSFGLPLIAQLSENFKWPIKYIRKKAENREISLFDVEKALLQLAYDFNTTHKIS